MNTIPFYKSRTFWVNAAALASLVFPDVSEWLKNNPVEFTSALAAVNVLLRFITVGKHGINDDDPTATAPVTDASTAANWARDEGSYKSSGTIDRDLDAPQKPVVILPAKK